MTSVSKVLNSHNHLIQGFHLVDKLPPLYLVFKSLHPSPLRKTHPARCMSSSTSPSTPLPVWASVRPHDDSDTLNLSSCCHSSSLFPPPTHSQLHHRQFCVDTDSNLTPGRDSKLLAASLKKKSRWTSFQSHTKVHEHLCVCVCVCVIVAILLSSHSSHSMFFSWKRLTVGCLKLIVDRPPIVVFKLATLEVSTGLQVTAGNM